MMFEMSFDLADEAALIRQVVNKSITEGIVTQDLAESSHDKSYTTSEVGDYLVEQILS